MRLISVRELTGAAANARNLQLIDVRSVSEFSGRHIPGAINIPLDEIELRLDDLSREATPVLICQSGQRARMAADRVLSVFPDSLVLDGGTVAWASEGLPMISTKKTRWSIERQVRLLVGLLVTASVVLTWTVAFPWIILAGLVGIGLTFAGATDICGAGLLLAKMPWNGASKSCATNGRVSDCG